jgi:hypothetical protein
MLFLAPSIMQVAVRDLPFLAPRELNIRIDLVFLKIEAKWGTTQQK